MPLFLRILTSQSNENYKLSVLRICVSILRYSKDQSDALLASKQFMSIVESMAQEINSE